jgi:hypothetical protein
MTARSPPRSAPSSPSRTAPPRGARSGSSRRRTFLVGEVEIRVRWSGVNQKRGFKCRARQDAPRSRGGTGPAPGVGRKAAALHWGARPSIERLPRGDDGIAVEWRHNRRRHLASRHGAAAPEAAKQWPPHAAG